MQYKGQATNCCTPSLSTESILGLRKVPERENRSWGLENVGHSTHSSFLHSLMHHVLDIRFYARNLGYQDAPEPMPILANKKQTGKIKHVSHTEEGPLGQRGAAFSQQDNPVSFAPCTPPRWRRPDTRPPGTNIPTLSGCRRARTNLPRALAPRAPGRLKAVRVAAARPLALRPLDPAPSPASALVDANMGVSARPGTSRRADSDAPTWRLRQSERASILKSFSDVASEVQSSQTR